MKAELGMKTCLLKILTFSLHLYSLVFWICLVLDFWHIAIWFCGPQAVDSANVYRAILGAVSFVAVFLLTFFTLVPIEIMTKIKSVQPFQKKYQGKIKWIVCVPMAGSILSLVIRLVLDLSGKLPFQENGEIVWAVATINSINSAYSLLQIRHFKQEMKWKGFA